jgi:hypothetical protein
MKCLLKTPFFLMIACLCGLLFFQQPLRAQCAGFPATIADADCSGGGSMSNNMNANGGTYGYCGSASSSASFTGINLNGATLRICGNTTLGFGSWNSGSLVVSCGATVTINSNLTLNSSCGIVNYGTLIINGSLSFQNSNNFVYNESPTSKMTVTGNINFPSNNGTNGYVKNAGYIKVGGSYNAYAGVQTCFLNGGRMECTNFVYMDQNANCNGVAGNRFTFGSASGSCILRYTGSANLYKAFTNDNRWNIYQASGSTQAIANPCNGNTTGWGSANVVSSAPAITVPSGEQPCNTITCLTLPVELLKFFALPSGDAVILSWATATETNCDYFSVERSSDGLSWKEITTVPGNGNSSQRNDYSYTDSYPGKGITYYRLLQHDYNGKRHSFEPVYVDLKGRPVFSSSLFPVPSSTGDVTLSLTGADVADLRMEVRNMMGELVPADIIPIHEYNSESGQHYLIRLPQNGQVFLITVLDGQNILARHKAYVLKD